MTELCTVVMSTALAMDVPSVSVNNFSYLRLKKRAPKAGVIGSNPVGRANFFNVGSQDPFCPEYPERELNPAPARVH